MRVTAAYEDQLPGLPRSFVGHSGTILGGRRLMQCQSGRVKLMLSMREVAD